VKGAARTSSGGSSHHKLKKTEKLIVALLLAAFPQAGALRFPDSRVTIRSRYLLP
jgi:hypothetical protein